MDNNNNKNLTPPQQQQQQQKKKKKKEEKKKKKKKKKRQQKLQQQDWHKEHKATRFSLTMESKMFTINNNKRAYRSFLVNTDDKHFVRQ